MFLTIDPGTPAGYAVFDGVRCVRVVQTKEPVIAALFEEYRFDRVYMEYPAFGAGKISKRSMLSLVDSWRRQSVEAAGCVGAGKIVDVPVSAWRAWADRGLVGEKESRAYHRALRMGVPEEWLTGPRGAKLYDAATAVCLGGWVNANL